MNNDVYIELDLCRDMYFMLNEKPVEMRRRIIHWLSDILWNDAVAAPAFEPDVKPAKDEILPASTDSIILDDDIPF